MVGITFHQRPQLTHQCISFRTRNSRQDLQQAVDALYDHQCAPVTRLDHQLREIRPHSKSGLPVHRDAVQHSTIHSGAPTEDASQSPVHSSILDDQPKHHSPRSAQITGRAGVHGSTGTTRLRFRPVQWWAATAWCQRTGSWTDRITVPQWVLSEVAWWASPAVLQGLPLATKETEVTLFTDASSSGWGAQSLGSRSTGTVVSISKIMAHQCSGDAGRHQCCERLPASSEVPGGSLYVWLLGSRSQLGSRSTQGQWSATQRSWHINVLEMQAVINAVRDFLPHLRSRVVRFMCDNAVTVAYIKNEGGTRLYTVMQMKICLLKWCDHKAITLVPVRLPGVLNIQADLLSRVGQTLNTEWRWPWHVYDPCQVGRATGRLVCDIRQQTTHQVCIAVSGPQGRVDGHHVGALGQREGPTVCFPAIQDGPSSSAEDRSVTGRQGDSDRSTATGSFMVSGGDVSVPRGSNPAVRWGSKSADSRRPDWRRGDKNSSLPVVKSTRVETLRAILRAKGHSREAAHMMSRSPDSSLQVYESHWARFVSFCRSKRWHVFRVRSHHFSTYTMHLFRDGLLPATIISHRTSVASVLRHWVYDSAADPHIKLLIKAFRLERLVQRRIMPKWDLHLVVSSLLKPPFASECDIQGEFSDDVIPLKWQTMKTVFLLALASARRRSYLHALSVSPGRCVFSRGATQRQLVVSLLPEPGFLAKNQLPSHAPEWISVPGIAHFNPSEVVRMLCPVRRWASADVCSLESQHQGHHEKSHEPMDRGDCQGSLHSSWSRVWPSYCTWGQSPVSVMGIQLSGSPTWNPVSSVLEVIWGVPEFVSTGHGLYRWFADGLSTLGPVVVAQQVVDPGHLHPPP